MTREEIVYISLKDAGYGITKGVKPELLELVKEEIFNSDDWSLVDMDKSPNMSENDYQSFVNPEGDFIKIIYKKSGKISRGKINTFQGRLEKVVVKLGLPYDISTIKH